MITIHAKRVTHQNFSKFGSAVTTPQNAPTSEGRDYRFWSDISHYLITGETEIGLCTVYKQSSVLISGLERHVKTPEILIPIDSPCVLPLLLDGKPESELEAFQVNVGEAVVIDSKVWHGACVPVEKGEATYFVIFRRNTPHEDVARKDIQLLMLSV